MHNRTFKRWSQFAHIVFSLPQLEHLCVYRISWEDDASIENPPSWLRFSRRLRKLQHDITTFHMSYGFLWLFFAGKRHQQCSSELAMNTQDVTILARITKLAMSMISDPDCIVYTGGESTGKLSIQSGALSAAS